MNTYYHVTPWKNAGSIRRRGLVPKAVRRGVFATSREPRVYLFTDRDTAEDAMMNWLVDEHPKDRYFAVIAVSLPGNWPLAPDEEIAGSLHTSRRIGPERVVSVERMDAGEEE